MLSLSLLGKPAIQHNDHPLPRKPPKKAQALLFYLSMSGYPCTRESLATLLWSANCSNHGRILVTHSSKLSVLPSLSGSVNPSRKGPRYNLPAARDLLLHIEDNFNLVPILKHLAVIFKLDGKMAQAKQILNQALKLAIPLRHPETQRIRDELTQFDEN